MTRDIIDIGEFIVLIEQSIVGGNVVEKCGFHDQIIGFSFYSSGNVELKINYADKTKTYHNTKGIAISYSADTYVEFVHNISYENPLQCVCVFITNKNLNKLSKLESEMFTKYIQELITPEDNFVSGPNFYMSSEMQNAVDKIFKTTYQGISRIMFIRSQVIELLSHFFAIVSEIDNVKNFKNTDREKLYQAKEILTNNIETPPSLNELSRLIGLNNYKLKKNFKELFGIPVFKHLQNERLNKAHDLLSTKDISIQEIASSVGYESLSSFSSAFQKKFGVRPIEIKKQFFSNKKQSF